MQIGWVKPPTPISGLDHLGTQSPCTLIYAQLLPGITNVTDRARYYSLYPWIVRSLDLRYKGDSLDLYVDFYRRADCLLTLISERHARQLKDEHHGQSMIGRLRLVPALTRLEGGEPLRLSTYATRSDDSKDRYFQNRLGGLGQYYMGQLAELRILDTSRGPWVTYTPDGGTSLAKTLDELPGAEKFWQTVVDDLVTVQDLDDLVPFCICGASHHEKEHRQLMDLFFVRTAFYEERTALGDYDPVFRRDSLRLLLHLAGALSKETPIRISEDSFRAAVYSGTLFEDRPWQLPDDLVKIRILWSIYERNDQLSMACLCVFSSALHALEVEGRLRQSFRTVEAFAAYLSRQRVLSQSITELFSLGIGPALGPDATFSDLVEYVRKTHPPVERWQEENHEINLAAALASNPPTAETYPQTLVSALRLLALLVSHESSFPAGYGDLLLRTSDLENYPIHLVSFVKRVERWRSLCLTEVIEDLIIWCLNTHLSVALRKLRQTRQCSFHLQPSEQGLETLGTIPHPVSTLPRIWQALQILTDLGALASSESSVADRSRGLEITPFGRSILEGSDA